MRRASFEDMNCSVAQCLEVAGPGAAEGDFDRTRVAVGSSRRSRAAVPH
jgi:hypothetical protein